MTNYNKSEVRRMQNGMIYHVREKDNGVSVWFKWTEASDSQPLGFFPNRDDAINYINNHQQWVKHHIRSGNPTKGK